MRSEFREKWLVLVKRELIIGKNGWESVGVDGCGLLFWEKWETVNGIGRECAKVSGGAGESR